MNIYTTHSSGRTQVFGSCHPRDCNWGWESNTPYASNVSQPIHQHAKALSAVYDPGFAEKLLVIKKKGRKLVVEVLTAYNGSRTNTLNRYVFKKRRRP
jgi:hypothetical protein